MKKIFLLVSASALALGLSACVPDVRAEQQKECASRSGVYHMGEDADDDVCVISRDEVIIFDNRERE